MIIFGKGGRYIAKASVGYDCANCEAQNSVRMYLVQRYTQVYRIPFFPSNKEVVSECSNCKAVLKDYTFPIAWDKDVIALKANAKTPWWSYTGVSLLVLGFIFIIITSILDKKESARLILDPKAGDVYEVKLGDDEYTLYKVDRIEGDVVYVYENQYVVDKHSGVHKLEGQPYFEESYPVSKLNLQYMFEKGEIIDVDRD